MQGEAACVRHIARDEINAAIHQAGNEMHVPCQPVELGDYEPCFQVAAPGEAAAMWAVVALDALDFGKLGGELAASGNKFEDGGALRVEP